MATTSTRKITLTFSGDVLGTQDAQAATNTSSAGSIEIKTLASGPNTITVPTGGTVPTAVTIIPPTANTTLMTLKGVTGDTGIPIHKTDPTSLAIDATVATFCLTAAASITGVRFIWS